ncbi:MAG: 50S ribosome-binding GTPase [Selenomonadaceae bacterium]|nr:50S ribosome-binding GTPase [Selenomonadaceae bacterium]
MRDYVSEFRENLNQINADSNSVQIINAGIMNHGKSSLFNSLLDREEFKAQDIRTTVESKSVEWQNSVYLIDTPGLEAEDLDDKVAYAAYGRANMIVFVHTVSVGELHEKELRAINKMKSMFPNEKFFWNHFCLVLTALDSQSKEDVKSIREKICSDISRECGGSNFQIFEVSNPRYQKGRDTNKEGLVERSGIINLREYLQSNFAKWRGENATLCVDKIDKAKKDFIGKLEGERRSIQARMNNKNQNIQRGHNYIIDEVNNMLEQYRYDLNEIQHKKGELQSLRENLDELKDELERSHANFD